MKYIDLIGARSIYASGGNVTEYLRQKLGEEGNTSNIIEIAYDLQAGSYIEYVNSNYSKSKKFASEIASFLERYVKKETSILDVGTGELTALTLMLNALSSPMNEVYAFDVSWSRIQKGREFINQFTGRADQVINTFVADMKCIPMRTNSVDVVTSCHALEPNGKDACLILGELFRVAREKLVLFEPSYELNSTEGRERMDRLGYIKNIEQLVVSAGGKVVNIERIQSAINPLNPTACYVIEPPLEKENHVNAGQAFCAPGTEFELERRGSFYVSLNAGVAFPILDEIPILKPEHGILATALIDA